MNTLKPEKLIYQLWEYWLLLAIILVGIFVRYYLVTYNLPVASNVDERFLLRILYKFDHENTLNPEFFQYPTFYLYVKYFLLKSFVDLKDFLYFGRLLNLVFSGLLAAGTFWLSKQVYKAAIPSLTAAALTMFSPTVIYSASYLSTDIQLALFCILSLFFLDKFFETKTYKPWLLGVLCMGLAFATKYSAISLIGTYFILESIYSEPITQERDSKNLFLNLLNTRLPTKHISFFLLSLFFIFLLFYCFYPSEFLWPIIQKEGDLNSMIDSDDKLFIESFREKFLRLSIFLGGLTSVSFFFKKLTERFGLLRPYVGLASVGVLLVMTTPFMLISWKKFIYDFGAVIKHSGEGSGSQWIPYIERYSSVESLLILAFLFIGLWHSWHLKNRILLIVVYLLVSCITIGAASQGYPRYLTPILPVMFIISAWGIYATGLWLAKKLDQRFLQKFLVLAVVAAIAIELSPHVRAQIFLPHNDMYASYDYVMQHKPSKVYYSAYAPDVELRLAGFEVEQLPLQSLIQNNVALLNQMKSTEVLILDGEAVNQIKPQLKQQLSLVLQATSDQSQPSNQFVFTKR